MNEEIKENQAKNISSEEIKTQEQHELFMKGLKIYGIWCIVAVVYSLFISIVYAFTSQYSLSEFISDFFQCLRFPIIAPLLAVIVFSPAILVLYFLYKNYSNTKTRVVLTAFIFPFMNGLYLYIEHLITGQDFIMLSTGLCGVLIVGIIPMAFITALCTPKSLLPFKKSVLAGIGLTYLFQFIMIPITFLTFIPTDIVIGKIKLSRYNSVIEYIEKRKIKDGKYPLSLNKVLKSSKHFEYKTLDNGENFILAVKDRIITYYYCSDKKLEECQEGYHNYRFQKKFGKWTRSIADHD